MKLDESLFQLPGLRHGLRFYVTGASPCPYLPGQVERKGFTHLTQDNPDALHDQLSRAGFRRSQGVAYRPACPSCNACRSVRVDVSQFKASRNQKRILRANADLTRRPIEARANREYFRLLKTYLRSRHDGGGMSDMGYREFCAMVNDSPVQTLMFEYRQGPELDSPACRCFSDRHSSRWLLDGLYLFRPRIAASKPWHVHDPRSYRSRE